jgi:hypothetical protein
MQTSSIFEDELPEYHSLRLPRGFAEHLDDLLGQQKLLGPFVRRRRPYPRTKPIDGPEERLDRHFVPTVITPVLSQRIRRCHSSLA